MQNIIIRQLPQLPYEIVWQAMQSFTNTRNPQQIDELWLLEHPPVFTLGQAGKPEHILKKSKIPIVHCDRGGQVTYHGPGQLIAYPLLDLRRLKLSPRQLVSKLEQTVIDVLASLNISAMNQAKAPGVYVDGAKICSIGLRIRRGCSYHGIAINVDMDLKPFSFINPCGYKGLQMTQISSLSTKSNMNTIKTNITSTFMKNFGYNQPVITHDLPVELRSYEPS